MDLLLFDVVGEAVRAMLPSSLGTVHVQARSYGIKVWTGSEKPGREHYEAQVIGPAEVDGATVLAVEIGFHAEHPKEADNDAVLDRLVESESRWRTVLGPDATADAFLGRAMHWRRLSETWPDPDLSDATIGLEIAGCLVDYVTVLEPIRLAR